MASVHLRKVRSFVRRPGRVTGAQQRALTELLPRFGIVPRQERLDLARVYGRAAPLVLDIGFGDGEALLTSAANNPAIDYLGIEVHPPGIGHLLLLLEKAALTNVRIIDRDAADIVPDMLGDACADAVNLFFPDPWPKKRHHKRRLLQPPFVDEIARVLKSGGLFHLATDWADYATHSREILDRHVQLVAVTPEDLCHNPLAFRPPTKFERRGRRLGHDVFDLFYRKTATAKNFIDEPPGI
jgi:tRNA (guanine-N7-)-methyltransferase